jgi:SAM-dependent methyltransferase
MTRSQPPSPVNDMHRQRQVAESFGEDAERYDRTRPRYPAEMVARIVAASPGLDVLDVGCGTGIAARAFQAVGCTVLGVEPDERMADFARGRGLEVEVATIEDWDPAGRTFDAVVAGTTWHWVDPIAGAVKAARVLRPGGRLALFWNVAQFPPALADAAAEAFRRVLPDMPLLGAGLKGGLDAYQPILTKAADGIRDGLSDLEQWRYDWEQPYTRDEWLDVMPTQGIMNRLSPEKLAEVLAAAGAAIDGMGGRFTMPYGTGVVTAVRTG